MSKAAGGFEMYRLLHQRYDRVTKDAEVLVMADITKMGAHQTSSSKDLRDKLANLQANIYAYEMMLGIIPDSVL